MRNGPRDFPYRAILFPISRRFHLSYIRLEIYIVRLDIGNNPINFSGSDGYSNLVLYGPHLTRFDLGFVKKTKITERINFEFRAEFLNAFNNTNLKIGSLSSDMSTGVILSSTAFGQIINAYQDPSTTNDPGGRLIQFVARINFQY